LIETADKKEQAILPRVKSMSVAKPLEKEEQDSKSSPKMTGDSVWSILLDKILFPAFILIGLWTIIATITGTNIFDVVFAFWSLITDVDSQNHFLIEHIVASLGRVVVGFTLAAVTAIPLGIAIGRYKRIDSILGPVIEATRPIPPLAWIPVSIIVFGIASGQPFIIWIGAFFPILTNTTTGVKRTEPVHIDVAKTLGANEMQILSKIVLPSASPEIFAGLRIGFGIGWMCLVAAEMVGGGLGLGFLIIDKQANGRTAEMIIGMLLIGLIGFFISYFFLYVEKKLLKGRQTVSV
jgi:ABC-type nitrate/sulfonate/bicarbonate transport system permease component